MKRVRRLGPRAIEASEGARKTATAILSVLSGLRTTSEACQALGISAMRYYVLETRGLQAFVRAMEPLPRGRRRSVEAETERLVRLRTRAEREASRWQALYRGAQKAMGLSVAKDVPGEKGRARRRPRVRAKALIAAIQSPKVSEAAEAVAEAAAHGGSA